MGEKPLEITELLHLPDQLEKCGCYSKCCYPQELFGLPWLLSDIHNPTRTLLLHPELETEKSNQCSELKGSKWVWADLWCSERTKFSLWVSILGLSVEWKWQCSQKIICNHMKQVFAKQKNDEFATVNRFNMYADKVFFNNRSVLIRNHSAWAWRLFTCHFPLVIF